MIESVIPAVRRRQETDLHRLLLEYVSDGPGAVLVTGAGGSGKSLFARRAAELLRSDGVVVLTARGRRAERFRPLALLVRLLAELPRRDRAIHMPLSTESAGATLVDLAARRPLALVVDDAQLADHDSLLVISRVLGAATVPVGVLLTGDARMATAIPPGCRSGQIQLRPFSEEEVAELVDRSEVRRRGAWFSRDCHEIGGGNPRLTTALIADGDQHPAPGRVELGPHYGAALRLALDRSSASLREVATALAVAGTDASPALLASLTGIDATQVAWSTDRLRELGILDHDRFRHPGIAALLLDRAHPWDLVCLHRRAVEFLGESGDPATVERHVDAACVLAERTSVEHRSDDGDLGATAAPVADTTAQLRSRRQAERAFVAIVTGGPSVLAEARLEQILHELEPAPSTIETIGAALSGIVYCDNPGRARYWCDRMLDRIATRGSALWAQVVGIRAEAALRQGDLDDALADAEAAMRSHSAHADPPGPATLAAYVLAGTRLGRHREVANKLREGVPADALQTRSALLYIHARGHHRAAVGAHTTALDDFLTCGELAIDRNCDQPSFVPWRSGAAGAFLALGDVDRARELLMEQLDLAGAGRIRGITKRLLALTLDREQRGDLLAEAVADLQRHPDRYELVQARRDLETIRWKHPVLAASGPGAPAWALGTGIGTGTGTTAVATSPRGPHTLSDAERRVADLAAVGLTNRSIAAELCITVSTVEQHLTRIYRKLGIRRRSQLRRFSTPA